MSLRPSLGLPDTTKLVTRRRTEQLMSVNSQDGGITWVLGQERSQSLLLFVSFSEIVCLTQKSSVPVFMVVIHILCLRLVWKVSFCPTRLCDRAF